MHDIHRLIEEYFDGTLGEEQERKLRDMLVTGQYTGEDVDEALAVMGYWAMERRRVAAPRRRARRASWAAAACAAVVIAAGVWIIHGHRHHDRGDSVAFVNGVEYTGSRADDIMHDQLALFSSAALSVEESVNDDLSMFSGLIE